METALRGVAGTVVPGVVKVRVGLLGEVQWQVLRHLLGLLLLIHLPKPANGC
jgi:hypothetical protein